MNFKKYFEKNPPAKLSDREELAIYVGGLITAVRIHSGLSQAKLAKKIGTKQPSLARAEAGDVIASIEFLYKIAKKVGKESVFLKNLSNLFDLNDSGVGNKTYITDGVKNYLSNSPYFPTIGDVIKSDFKWSKQVENK
jgi:DNA-binding XRE family transcriptional regulator